MTTWDVGKVNLVFALVNFDDILLRTCQAGASEKGVPADTQRSCKPSTLLRRIPLAHHEATHGWWTTIVRRDCRWLVQELAIGLEEHRRPRRAREGPPG